MVSDSWPLGWERVDFCPFIIHRVAVFATPPGEMSVASVLTKAPLSPVALSLPTPRPCCPGPVSALPPGPATRDPPRTLSHSCPSQPGHPARAGPLWSPLPPQGPSKARAAQPPVPGAQQTLLSAPRLAAAQGLLQDPAAPSGAGGVTSMGCSRPAATPQTLHGQWRSPVSCQIGRRSRLRNCPLHSTKLL